MGAYNEYPQQRQIWKNIGLFRLKKVSHLECMIFDSCLQYYWVMYKVSVASKGFNETMQACRKISICAVCLCPQNFLFDVVYLIIVTYTKDCRFLLKEGYWDLWIIWCTTKRPLRNMRTMQALISLRICAGWSGPSLSTYRINGYCSICLRTKNVQIRLHGCARSSGPSLFTNGIRAFLPCASYDIKCAASWENQLMASMHVISG